jgi:hypothetical protein
LKEETQQKNAAKAELSEQIQKNNTFKDLLKQEGRTRTDLKAQLAQLQQQIQSLQQGHKEVVTVNKDKDKLTETLESLTQQLRQEELVKKQLIDKLTETEKKLIVAYNQIAQLQAAPEQGDGEKERHLALGKELKARIAASHSREWDTIYSSPEVDDAIPGVKTDPSRSEQIIWEWHANKLTEIQNSFYPFGEKDITLVEPHRRFIKIGPLTTMYRRNPVNITVILFNDMLLMCTVEEKFKNYLFMDVISLDSCSVETIADTNESK